MELYLWQWQTKQTEKMRLQFQICTRCWIRRKKSWKSWLAVEAGDGLPAGTYTTFYRCRLIAADGGWYGEILGNGSW